VHRHRRLPLLVLVVLGFSSCGHADAEAPTTTTSPTTEPSCSSPADSGADSGAGSIVVDGIERTYTLHLPAATAEPAPLVVLLHGHHGSATRITAATGLPDAAVAAGYVVAVPDGLGDPARWNFDGRPEGPDDGAFLDALLAEMEATACVDLARVALVGSSNGAAFAGTQACTAAAVVMVIATLPPECPGAPPSILTIRGTADATVAYEGTPEMVAAMAAGAGCGDDALVDRPHPGVERTAYTDCAGGGSVVLDTVDGAVHAWPGGSEAQRPGNSDAGRTFDASAEILAFLRPVLTSA
jgi:polyhydroxybutyrate depolymerase